MLLVDKDISVFLSNGSAMNPDGNQTAIIGGDASSITNIGYDLTTKKFYKLTSTGEDSCTLLPGESTFAESAEHLQFDNHTAGIVSLRNSRIRQGLSLDAPIYQPGHNTPIRFRLTNISDKTITLDAGEKHAMLLFEQLSSPPDHPYDGAFQKELTWRGMGAYNSQYAAKIKEIEDKTKDLHSLERTVYGNVITILTIFVGIFTLLNVNISLVEKAASAWNFLLFNLSTLGDISFLAALLDTLLNREKPRRWLWAIPLVLFMVLIVLSFCK